MELAGGGGPAILVRDTFHVKKREITTMKSFEYSDWIIVSGSSRIRLVVI